MARLSALLLIGAILWAVAMVTIIYIPAVFLGSGAAVRVALTSGWLGATASGLVMARRYQARREGGEGGAAWVWRRSPRSWPRSSWSGSWAGSPCWPHSW